MTTLELLQTLQSKNIKLWADAGKLKFRAPEGAMTPEIIQDLKAHKGELLDLLAGQNGRSDTISAAARDQNLPASMMQNRLWFLDQMTPGTPIYNIPLRFHFHGALEVTLFTDSINEIVARHEILRTTFAVENEQPVQKIAPKVEIPVPVIDLSHFPQQDQEIAIKKLYQEVVDYRFDLEIGPLLYTELLKLADDSYIWLINFHHIISDGWSSRLFFQELSTLYSAKLEEKQPNLPPLPIQYGDFAAWQNEAFENNRFASQLHYWEKQLSDAPSLLELPTDKIRPSMQTFSGDAVTYALPDELLTKLRQLNSKTNTTLFMLLLSTFKLLMSRLSHQEDVVVGIPIAGRNRIEIEPLIGFFINSLALRSKIKPNDTFLDLLEQVRNTNLDAYANQDIPFEQVIELLKIERNLSQTPIFQVYFNMFMVNDSGLDLPNIEVVQNTEPELSAKFDMTLYVREHNDDVLLRWVYNKDLFYKSRIKEMVAQFVALLDQLVAEPNQRLASLNLQTPLTESRLPDPTAPLSDEWFGGVHERLTVQAQQQPHKTAVSDDDTHWTYAQLEQQSNKLAHHLITQGIKNEDIVGVYAHRSASLVWALMGILKAGAAFTILDPAYPPERLQRYIEVAQPSGLIRLDEAGDLPQVVADTFSKYGNSQPLTLPDLETAVLENILGDCPDTSPMITVGPDDLAAVSFTSGSTGLPKGVMGKHGSLSHFLPWQTEQFSLTPDDHFSMLSGLSHDPLQRDIFTTIWSGATLHIPTYDTIHTPGALASWMAEQQISFAHLTPPMAQLLTETAVAPIPTLRFAFFVGDKLTKNDVQNLRKIAPRVTCINSLGSTETQRAVSYFLIPPNAHTWQKSVYPLGQGMPDVQLLLLSENMQMAGIGEVAEIYMRSPHLSLGYLGDAERTNERFITNPFTQHPTDRLYKTGDLGRYLPNGEVVFFGRADRQVNIRGFRIELGEVEGAFAKHPAVKQAIVQLYQHPSQGPSLTAYVVTAHQASQPTDLSVFLKNHLPAYMIPSPILFLEEMPLTPNGKIDQKALPNPLTNTVVEQKTAVSPRTPQEKEIALIWSSVLGMPQISVFDNFFELGGHSLLATRVISRLRDKFNVDIPLQAIFRAPTVAEMAHEINSLEPIQKTHIPDATHPFKIKSTEKTPLSFAQQRLWFLEQLEPGKPTFHLPKLYDLTGEVDPIRLSRAVRDLAKRHSILRTAFEPEGDSAYQKVYTALDNPFKQVDLSKMSPEDAEMRFTALLNETIKRPFNFQNPPLWRIVLIKFAPARYKLLLVFHHIITDGWSASILYRDLSELYRAQVEGRPPNLPELPLEYSDYVKLSLEKRQGPRAQQQFDYWTTHLKGAPPLIELPTDRVRPPQQSYAGAKIQLDLSEQTVQAIYQFSQQHNVTNFMLLLTTLNILLQRYSGQSNVVVGTPLSNRTDTYLENMLGHFVNSLPLHTDLSNNPDFFDLLAQVRETAVNAYTHQDTPFEQLVELIQPERSLSHHPLYQVMFILHNTPNNPMRFPNVAVEANDSLYSSASALDLTMTLRDKGEGIAGYIEYNTDLFDEATILRFGQHFKNLLDEILANPYQAISQFDLLSEQERQEMLIDWNQTAASFPAEACLHQRVEYQAAKAPNQVALINEASTVTYDELNKKANQLAHHLVSLGIELETPVGISLHRSPQMIIGMLAVLKAGGAFVSLDPTYPKERLGLILEDSQIGWVLTETAVLPALPTSSAKPICLDTLTLNTSAENLQTAVKPQNLAYLLYTSGSTGRPKGVMGTHQNGVNRLSWMQAQYPLTHSDVCVSKSSINFVDGVSEIFEPLIHGGALLLIPNELLLDPKPFVETLNKHRVSRILLVPSLLRLLLDTFPDIASRLPHLQLWTASGEALPQDLWADFYEKMPEATLLNLYGLSEYADATCFDTLHFQNNRPNLPIGAPIANTQLFVLDAWQQPVPVGVEGELYVGGSSLSRGYWQQEALTKERYPTLLLPPLDKPVRLLKTGDRVRYLPDGNIEYTGRRDHQVKIRGFRVELGEIENRLLQHPAVQQAAVVTQPNPATQQPQILAYYVAEQALGVGELRPYLLETLPNYFIPSAFVQLETMPLTPNGKINRLALPVPSASQFSASTAQVNPITQTQTTLVEIWQEILALSELGIEDNFFELGGHSLLAVRLFNQIEERLGVKLPLTSLFQFPTIAELAKLIDGEDLVEDGFNPLVVMQQGDDEKRPFFYVHGLGGGVLDYGELARLVGTDQPAFGILAQGVDGTLAPHHSIEEMATFIIDTIKKQQPEGPYQLGGYCYGGVVAYEAAYQLEQMGEEVTTLGIFEGYAPLEKKDQERFWSSPQNLGHFLQNIPYWIHENRQLDSAVLFARFKRKLRSGWKKLLQRFGADNELAVEDVIDDISGVSDIYQKMMATQLEARRGYQPKQIKTNVALFRTKARALFRSHDPFMGWKKLTRGDVNIHMVEGEHFNILEQPNVASLADALKQELEQ
ncbi:MAG: amino acid adenylation domain-containing protein [Chloroflexota bacterium]